ncbi:hypothetical protein [Zunongwangia pacifica]|uniref:Lipoprotein n=1 Tax=Zunongwangia pacifica TaxID=2911062 RepID=A0A9X1ZSU8_9FLAO|nr:hypothetical protein [Zunongwangia pacifica]MCL6219501.1 hypothetical protein [Zunongwangia pacifica]
MTLRKITSIAITALTLFVACKNKNNSPSQEAEKEVKEVQANTTVDKDSIITKLETSAIKNDPKYICYTFDDNKEKRIWIEFDENDIAQKVKYEGQQESIHLKHTKEEYSEGGAHPTIVNYYDEIYKDEVNGTYKLTHSGVWDYVTYIRGKDGKKFHYTIDHDQNPYGNKPCF